jgi:hypothetical protein
MYMGGYIAWVVQFNDMFRSHDDVLAETIVGS